MDELIAALEASHSRLAGLLDGMSDEQAASPSYDDEWTIGQVASHLGSGAEIFTKFVAAGLDGSAAPGPDDFQPVWDEWNAKSAGEQVRDVVAADREFLDQITQLPAEQRDAWSMDMFGQQRDLRMVLGMRLSEHAAHTWDIAVALDPSATVAADAAGLIIDGGGLAMMAGMVGKPSANPVEVAVTTTDPARSLRLRLGEEGAALDTDPAAGEATLATSAEAFFRLVYGRLDPDHTPDDVTAAGVDLEAIRAAFPGF
jgi:uncharacterized protein (TIGR03083 family)